MSIRALTFDVFGTVVDWRSSVLAEVRGVAAEAGVEGDWEAFVDAWRYDGYIRAIAKVQRGELPFMTADELHRRKLDELLPQYGLEPLPEERREELNRAWHRLAPWPDSAPGLARLRTRYIVSTLSNGNLSLLVDLARYGGLQWDCVLSADLLGAFKPDPAVYLGAAKHLGLAPEEILMVAAHKNDLFAAQKVGLRTAFIPRPLEAGPSWKVDLEPDPTFDFYAGSLEDLASLLGC